MRLNGQWPVIKRELDRCAELQREAFKRAVQLSHREVAGAVSLDRA